MSIAKTIDDQKETLRLLIVIVNFCTPELSIDCLRSLSTQVPAINNAHVVVIDNGSSDGSVEEIRQVIDNEGWHSWVTLMPLENNLGFAGGNNRGLKAFPDVQYALLLNSDTIVHDNCLDYCLKVMENEPEIGAMSCKLLNLDGSVQTVTRKFPTPLRMIAASIGLPWRFPKLFGWANIENETWDKENAKCDVDWLGGAFLLVRGNVLNQIGLLDEDFFFYGEDVEFSHRIFKAGYRRHYDPTASIVHLGGGSSDSQRISQVRQQTAFWNARYLVQRKCYGLWAAIILRILDLAMLSLRIVALRLLSRKKTEKYQEAVDMWQLLSKPLVI